MLYTQTSKIKISTVGASFTVTFSAAPDEIGYLTALHEKYAEMNMCGFTIKPNSSEKPNNCETCGTPKHLCQYCIAEDRMWTPKTEPQTSGKPYKIEASSVCKTGEQTDIEIARAIVHKAIDDTPIAEDAYPDLRQKMHDAVDNYEPQTDCAWKKGEE